MTELSSLQKARLYIRYRFVPEPNWDVLKLFSDADFALRKREYARMTAEDLLAQVDNAARAAFEHTFEDLGADIAIPLTGGRDSRFILCMAREYGLSHRVTAITWGAPGGLDFDLAAKLAQELGFRHEAICTADAQIAFSDLHRAYTNGARWTDLLFAHFNQAWRRFVGPDASAVVGYLGGPPAGSHYEPGQENLDFAASVAAFERTNCRQDVGTSAVAAAANRLLPRHAMSWPEQLDLVFRQEGYLRRIVASGARVPFAHPQWLRTMYALPAAHRVNSCLFTRYLTTRFPDAFVVGVSRTYGMMPDAPEWRRRVRRRLLLARNAAANLTRHRKFMTFDKYGDERDLLATLQPDAEQAAPKSYRRLLAQRRPGLSPREAAVLRRNVMIVCNLAFERACATDAVAA